MPELKFRLTYEHKSGRIEVLQRDNLQAVYQIMRERIKVQEKTPIYERVIVYDVNMKRNLYVGPIQNNKKAHRL